MMRFLHFLHCAQFFQATLLLVVGFLTLSYPLGLIQVSTPHLLAQHTGAMTFLGILGVIVGAIGMVTSRRMARETRKQNSAV